MVSRNQTDHRAARKYLREFLPALLGYTIAVLAISITVDFDTAGWWKYPIGMLPMVPAVWGLLAISRHIARVDEMQRSIMVEGLAFGFGLAMIAALTVGFLSISGLDVDKWGPWAIYSIGMLGWIVGQTRSNRKVQ